MRFVTLQITRPGGFHPTNERLDAAPTISRVAAHHLQSVADGSLVILYELRGDLERAGAIIGSHPDTSSFDVVGEDPGIAYVHGVPTPPVSASFEVLARSSIVLDSPVEIVDEGARFMFVGEREEVQAFVDELPGTFDVERLRSGESDPAPGHLSSLLTPRQRTVLGVAIEEGYYEVPRRSTREEIADRLGVTPETVNEHLRTIEGRVLSRIVV